MKATMAQFSLRARVDLWERIKAAANLDERSINSWILRQLERALDSK